MSPEAYIISPAEEPIRATGWGLYSYFAIGMACACTFSQATAFTSVPFAIPLAFCDSGISEKIIVAVDTCFCLGMAIGGFLLSSISDITGRKVMIPLSLMMIFGSTFACAFAQGSTIILSFMFILGSGLITNNICVKIHLAEILPYDKRGVFLTILDMFWGIGYMLSSVVNWLLTPSVITTERKDIHLATWRIIFGLSGLLSIFVACGSALLLPSPRYLLYWREYAEALDTLKHIFAINNSKHSDSYSMCMEQLIGRIDDYNINNEPPPLNCMHHTKTVFRVIKKALSHLFNNKYRNCTILLIFFKFGVLFGFSTINVWLSKMTEQNVTSECNLSVPNLLHLYDAIKCKALSTSFYKNYFLIALQIIVGQAILLLTIDRFGRKISIFCGCFACGASSFALGYVHNVYVTKLLISFVFMMAYSIIDSVLTVIVIEAYPTAFRGTAAGLTQFFARFTSGIIKVFLEMPCQYSFIFMGAAMLVAAVLCRLLPEYHKRPMME